MRLRKVKVEDVVRVLETGQKIKSPHSKYKWEYIGTYVKYNSELGLKVVVGIAKTNLVITVHPFKLEVEPPKET